VVDKQLISNLNTYRVRINQLKEAIYDYDNDKRYSYQELGVRSDKLAYFLNEILDLKKGDRIAFCAQNTLEFIDGFYASCKTGIIVTTYNCLLNNDELGELIDNESPKVIFYDYKYKKTIDYLKNIYTNIIFVRLGEKKEKNDDYCYEDIMDIHLKEKVEYVDLSMEDIQMLIHTGGTTGLPKAAKMSYRSIYYNSLSEVLTLGLSSSDSVYVFLPFFHTAAWNVLTLPLLLSGGRIILTKQFDPRIALKIIEEEKPTVAIGVETIYRLMAEQKEFNETDFSSYRWMLSGAAPISRETMEIYWDKGVKIVNAYGMTEIGPNNLAPPVNEMTIDDIKEKWNSAGKPMFFNNVRIVDEKGKDVGDGEYGELIWKSNLIFSGYFNNEVGTKQVLKDGWIYTGDIGKRDEDGFYYINGRRKNMYITGGENIFPIEIEMLLNSNPNIKESCVIGVKDKKWGEVGKALIVLEKDKIESEEKIRDFIKENISSIKRPKYIKFIEKIPKNQVGKLDMKEIKKIYGESEC